MFKWPLLVLLVSKSLLENVENNFNKMQQIHETITSTNFNFIFTSRQIINFEVLKNISMFSDKILT